MLYDVVVSFIGAFLGFAFALLSEAIIQKIVRKRDINSYLRNIQIELRTIRNSLDKHKDSADISLFFDIPIWEAFISSGDIRYLMNKSYYSDLLNTYSKIKRANELESVNRDDVVDNLVISKRNEIYSSIRNLFDNQEFRKSE